MAVEIELDHGTLLVRSLVASPDLGVARVAERVRRGGRGTTSAAGRVCPRRSSDARRLLREGLEANPHDSHLNRLGKLLALPKTAKIAKRDVDRTEEFQWLAERRDEYRDRWVAVQGKELVACAESLKELRQILRDREFEIPPLIHRIE